jgi:hypothetical protein
VTDAERIARLEEAVRCLILYATDAQPSRLTRSLSAGAAGSFLVEYFDALESERDAGSLGPQFLRPKAG